MVEENYILYKKWIIFPAEWVLSLSISPYKVACVACVKRRRGGWIQSTDGKRETRRKEEPFSSIPFFLAFTGFLPSSPSPNGKGV